MISKEDIENIYKLASIKYGPRKERHKMPLEDFQQTCVVLVLESLPKLTEYNSLQHLCCTQVKYAALNYLYGSVVQNHRYGLREKVELVPYNDIMADTLEDPNALELFSYVEESVQVQQLLPKLDKYLSKVSKETLHDILAGKTLEDMKKEYNLHRSVASWRFTKLKQSVKRLRDKGMLD
jgi:hypothetical protein